MAVRAATLGSRRRLATGYGSPLLARASACGHALRYRDGDSSVGLTLALCWLPYLIGLLCLAPRTSINVSKGPSGELIRSHLRLRRWGLPRFRLAQGVLHLPEEYATYLRGRSRQAVRTNIARAQGRGIRCTSATVHGWLPAEHSCGQGAPVEYWRATNRAGTLVGEAWVTVDQQCALLHSMTTSETDVRWFLHAAITEQLCARGCRQLLTDSHDAFLLPPGQQYFQHRLGYSVERVCVAGSLPVLAGAASRMLAVLVLLASAAAVGEQALASIL
jgi:hypothetical protein